MGVEKHLRCRRSLRRQRRYPFPRMAADYASSTTLRTEIAVALASRIHLAHNTTELENWRYAEKRLIYSDEATDVALSGFQVCVFTCTHAMYTSVFNVHKQPVVAWAFLIWVAFGQYVDDCRLKYCERHPGVRIMVTDACFITAVTLYVSVWRLVLRVWGLTWTRETDQRKDQTHTDRASHCCVRKCVRECV